ncbi:MAG: polyprenyl synthetase family protein [Deltaproteobacteria bacterium]|nr:polyprenyl synthetase family protein [Deltaproteobacteria bacterium]
MSSKLKRKIFALIKKDFEGIEDALGKNLNPYLDLVSQTANHILFSGGKRLRPLLMVLSARICGYEWTGDKSFSIMVEYLHAATLLHDDLVDDAALRRGKPVAHSISGNSTAVLVGDFLLARALSIAAQTEKIKIIKVIARITEEMSQGEIHQLIRKGHLDLSEKEYMEVIRRKTAVLIDGACRVGTLIADATEKEETALADYGLNMGIAFQMADDLLDYTSDTKSLGKEVGTDLKEGKLTLPVIYALKRAGSKDKSLMESIIKNKDFSVREFEMFKELLKKYQGIAYTENMAAEYIEKATEGLCFFKDSKTKKILLMLADYALARKA